jgi:outer membrane protein assembly factor BamB
MIEVVCATTGDLLLKADNWRSATLTRIDAGTVYVETSDSFYAMRIEDGHIKWRLENKIMSVHFPDSRHAVVCIKKDAQLQVVQAHDQEDGALLWSRHFPARTSLAKTGHSESLSLVRGVVLGTQHIISSYQ